MNCNMSKNFFISSVLTCPSGVSAGHIIPHCELCKCLGLASFPKIKNNLDQRQSMKRLNFNCMPITNLSFSILISILTQSLLSSILCIHDSVREEDREVMQIHTSQSLLHDQMKRTPKGEPLEEERGGGGRGREDIHLHALLENLASASVIKLRHKSNDLTPAVFHFIRVNTHCIPRLMNDMQKSKNKPVKHQPLYPLHLLAPSYQWQVSI